MQTKSYNNFSLKNPPAPTWKHMQPHGVCLALRVAGTIGGILLGAVGLVVIGSMS